MSEKGLLKKKIFQKKALYGKKKFFLEDFRKKRFGINKHRRKEFVGSEKKRNCTENNVRFLKPGLREIILSFLVSMDFFFIGLLRKQGNPRMKIFLDQKQSFLIFQLSNFGLTLFDLKKIWEIFFESEFGFIEGNWLVSQKSKRQKKTLFFKKDYFLSNPDIIELISINSGNTWKIEKKKFQEKKILRILNKFKQRPHIFLKVKLQPFYFESFTPAILKKEMEKTVFLLGFPIFISSIQPENTGQKPSDLRPHYTNNFLKDSIWNCSPTLILKREYFVFFQSFGYSWEYPLGMIHINSPDERVRNICICIPRNKLFENSKKQSGTRDPDLILHSKGKLFPQFSDYLVPNWLNFLKGVIENDEIVKDLERGKINSTPDSERFKINLIKKIIELLAFISNKSPLTYAYFWKNFGFLLKSGICKNQNLVKNFAPLIRFYSTFSRLTPISISDYVKRKKKNQVNIFYCCIENFTHTKKHPAFEKMFDEGIEIILLGDIYDEILIKKLNSEQKKKKGRVPKFINISSLEFFLNSNKKEQKSQKKFKSLERWYSKILEEKVLEIRLSETLEENATFYLNSRVNNSLFMDYFPASSRRFSQKNLFLGRNFSKIFQVGLKDKLNKLLNFYVISEEKPKLLEQIGTLVWEITYLKYELEFPGNFEFKKRIDLISCYLLILILLNLRTNRKINQ